MQPAPDSAISIGGGGGGILKEPKSAAQFESIGGGLKLATG